MIDAVAATYSVKTLFVWQPAPGYKYDLTSHLFAGRAVGQYDVHRRIYPLVERLMRKNFFGENFIWAADIQEGVHECLYVDVRAQ